MVDMDTGIIAVKFEASWCGPCKVASKILNKIQSEFPKVKIQTIDIDEDPKSAKKFKIRTLPTVILLKEGQEIRRFVGQAKIDELREAFRNLVEDRAA